MAKLKIRVALHKGEWWNPWGRISFYYDIIGAPQQPKKTQVAGIGPPQESIELPEIEVSAHVLKQFNDWQKHQGIGRLGFIRRFFNTVCVPYIQQHTHHKVDLKKDETERLTPVTVFKEACDMALWINAIRQRPVLATEPAASPELKAEVKALPKQPVEVAAPYIPALDPVISAQNMAHYLAMKRSANTARRWLKPFGVLLMMGLAGLVISMTGGMGLLGLELLYETLAVVGLLGAGTQGVMLLDGTSKAGKIGISLVIVIAAVLTGVLIGISGGAIPLLMAGGAAVAIVSGYLGGFIKWLMGKRRTPTWDPKDAPFTLSEEPDAAEAKVELKAEVAAAEAKVEREIKLPEGRVVPAPAGPRDEKEEINFKILPAAAPVVPDLKLKLSVREASVAVGAAAAIEVKAAVPITKERLFMLDIDENLTVSWDPRTGTYTAPWKDILQVMVDEHAKIGIKVKCIILTSRGGREAGWRSSEDTELAAMLKNDLGEFLCEPKIIFASWTAKGPLLKQVVEREKIESKEVFGFDDQFDNVSNLQQHGYHCFQTPYSKRQGWTVTWQEWFQDTVFPRLGISLSPASAQKLGIQPAPVKHYQRAYRNYSQAFDRYQSLLTAYQKRHDPAEQKAFDRSKTGTACPIQIVDGQIKDLEAKRDQYLQHQDQKSFSQARVYQAMIGQYQQLKGKHEALLQQVKDAQVTLQKRAEIKETDETVLTAETQTLHAMIQEIEQAEAGTRTLDAQIQTLTREGAEIARGQNPYKQAQEAYEAVLTQHQTAFDNQVTAVRQAIVAMAERNAPASAIRLFEHVENEIKAVQSVDYDPLCAAFNPAQEAKEDVLAQYAITGETRRISQAQAALTTKLQNIQDAQAGKVQQAQQYLQALKEYDGLIGSCRADLQVRRNMLARKIELLQAQLAALGPNAATLQQDESGLRFGKWAIFFKVLDRYQALDRQIEKRMRALNDEFSLRRYLSSDLPPPGVGFSDPRALEIARVNDARTRADAAMKAVLQGYERQIDAVATEEFNPHANAVFAERRGWLQSETYLRHGLMSTTSQDVAERLAEKVSPRQAAQVVPQAAAG